MKFAPLGDNIVVRPLEGEAKSASGLFMVSGNEGNVVCGTVVSIGQGRYLQGGDLVPTLVRPGNKIWYQKVYAIEISVDGETVYVISEQYVLGYTE